MGFVYPDHRDDGGRVFGKYRRMLERRYGRTHRKAGGYQTRNKGDSKDNKSKHCLKSKKLKNNQQTKGRQLDRPLIFGYMDLLSFQ